MDTAVRQRLLGGIVLIAGAAVLLPLMLDGSGAKLLSRLEPIPKPPVTTTVEQTRPQLNQQQQEAEDQVATEHPEDPQFYPMGQTAVAPAPTLNTAKSPEQLAAEQAARNRAMALLNGTDGASVEEAQAQKRAEDKAEQEFKKQQAELTSTTSATPTSANSDTVAQQQASALLAQAKAEVDAEVKAKAEKIAAKKLEAEKALVMLESPDSKTQKAAEKLLAEKAAKQHALDAQTKLEKLALEEKAKVDAAKKKEEKAKLEKAQKLLAEKDKAKTLEKDKAEQLAADKAEKLAAEKEKAKAEKLMADKEKAKTEKLAAEKEKAKAEKLAADKSDKLAAEKAKADKLAAEKEKLKAETKKKEEEKAKLALEGKQKEQAKEKEQAKDKEKSEAWVVQVASMSDRTKADALSTKLAAKGYRARVVKSGDSWKVVVGPELQKEAANGLKGRLSKESSLGVSGAWVTPWKP